MMLDRGSTAPVSLEPHNTGSIRIGAGPTAKPSPFDPILKLLPPGLIPQQLLGMSGYLVGGVFLGLVLIVVLSLSRGGDAAPPTSAGVVTDQVVRLHAKDIGETCWAGISTDAPARLTVLVDVGVDGRVRSVIANGASATMKGCIETHVKNWEFLPQARPFQDSLPFEVDRR